MNKLVTDLNQAIASLNQALISELDKEVLSSTYEEMVLNTPADISARYWLIQFLSPLSRKELQSVVDGFLVQMLNEEQAKKLVKFLLIRFPNYYSQDPNAPQQPQAMAPTLTVTNTEVVKVKPKSAPR